MTDLDPDTTFDIDGSRSVYNFHFDGTRSGFYCSILTDLDPDPNFHFDGCRFGSYCSILTDLDPYITFILTELDPDPTFKLTDLDPEVTFNFDESRSGSYFSF